MPDQLLSSLMLANSEKPKRELRPVTDEQRIRFADWTGSGGMMDSKTAAKDLQRRGMVGAQMIIDDNAKVDINSPASIKNSQADWKPAVVSEILSNALKYNLRTPEEINANRDLLVRTPKFKEAMNNFAFKQLHPNFWDVVSKSIIPEQYAKFDQPAPPIPEQVVKR